MKRAHSMVVAVFVTTAALVAQTPESKNRLPPRSSTYPVSAAQKSDAALDQVVKDYETTFNRGDAKALARLYAENGIRLGLKNEVLHGRAAIEQFYVASFSGKPGTLSLRPVRTEMMTPDVAVLEGRYEVAATTGVHGLYVVTAVRQGGHWKLASVVSLPDAP